MTADTANAYLRTQVLTASPEQLRLMLLDGAIRFLHQGREGLAARDYEASFDGFTKCRGIILELINTLRPDVDRALCAQVQALYMFIYQTTIEASLEKSTEKAGKALELLEFERETWVLAMRKLADERGAGGGPSSAAPPPTVAAERRTLSLHA